MLMTYALSHSLYMHMQLSIGPRKIFGLSLNLCRAYPGSDFVVANTLAKWKKLEPNEINFSQGFSQKVVSQVVLYLTLCALVANFVVC